MTVRPTGILSTLPVNSVKRVAFEESTPEEDPSQHRCFTCNSEFEVTPVDLEADVDAQRRSENAELQSPGIKVLKSPGTPTAKEIEEHEATHLPYRAWCRHCVAGYGKDDYHRKVDSSGNSVPVVACDYCFMGERIEDEKLSAKCLPILVVKDSAYGVVDSQVVPNKGTKHPYPATMLAKAIERRGLPNIIFRSDQEPSIVELKRAAAVDLREKFGLYVQPEESKVGDSKANGFIERAVWDIEGMIRTLVSQAAALHNTKIETTDDILTWAVRYAGQIITRARRSADDGLTAYQRVRGKEYAKRAARFGERVLDQLPKGGADAAEHKLEPPCALANGPRLAM